MEQEEYTREQINWSYIEFVDNQDVLDLIEKVWVGHYNMCYLVVSKPRNFFYMWNSPAVILPSFMTYELAC